MRCFSFLFLLISCHVSADLSVEYRKYFDVGVALSSKDLASEESKKLAVNGFSSWTHEFAMKWSQVEVKPGQYNFEVVDEFVKLGVENNKKIIGHTLVWYKANPTWLAEEPNHRRNREYYLQKLRTHISTLVGRYKGKIYGWDVVNEAFTYDGNYRNNIWYREIGEDYIQKSFEFAHAADPNAKLFYNDFGLVNLEKQDAVFKAIKALKKKGVPIHGIGIQGHYSLSFPDLSKLDHAIKRFSLLDLDVMITELDISVLPHPGPEEKGEEENFDEAKMLQLNPYSVELPVDVEKKFDERYQNIFCVLLRNHKHVDRVTFWGLSDSRSWRNDWPIQDRVDYPLLFDRNMKKKAVFDKLVTLAKGFPRSCDSQIVSS